MLQTNFFEIDTDIDFSDDLEILPDDNFMPKLSDEYRKKLEKDYFNWNKNGKNTEEISDSEVINVVMTDLMFLSKMSVEEYTLYRKWVEIHRDYPYDDYQSKKISNFWTIDNLPVYTELERLKKDIWIPAYIEDYKNLKPKMTWTNFWNNDKKEWVTNSNIVNKWNALRIFLSTMINNSNIGRNLYFIVEDDITNKILGIISISSDFLDLTVRDNYIGWSRELKTQGRMINHTAIGSTIVPTQPLGYNYVGGKLIALLTASSVVEDFWNSMYNISNMPSKLVGVTTTSLYSSFSQYTNLKNWQHLGHSAGSVKFEPSEKSINLIKKWLIKNHPRKYWEWYIATEPQGMPLKRDYKQRSLSFVYSQLKIEKKYFETSHQRGIYFCPLFTNTKEYLRNEVSEDKLIRKFDNSIESLTNLWKDKYASKRINSLVEQNRVSSETLFYDDIIKMSWIETKNKYLKEVGR